MKFLYKSLIASAAVVLSTPLTAHANTWPSADKPIQITVPAPGGGGTGDTIARMLAEQLAVRLKTNVIIENKPGANGNIGATAAAKYPPDGYRFLFSWAGTLAVNKSLYASINYDPQKDFDPIALICDVPNILVVNNDQPIKSIQEFIAYANTNPGKLNFGSTQSKNDHGTIILENHGDWKLEEMRYVGRLEPLSLEIL
jgi:tripartite-type tricarboxylate transporter receptor subunit TctC